MTNAGRVAPGRLIDRGAIVAAGVGVGMVVTIGVSFLLVIPIEPVYWYLALPAGVMIGYYANARSRRAGGPWPRILVNGLVPGLATGIAYALLLLGIKALFFNADNGYRDQGGSLTCTPGPDCVYQRYVAAGQGGQLEKAGVHDAASFSALYWREQLSTATLVLVLPTVGALTGAALFGITQRRSSGSATS